MLPGRTANNRNKRSVIHSASLIFNEPGLTIIRIESHPNNIKRKNDTVSVEMLHIYHRHTR